MEVGFYILGLTLEQNWNTGKDAVKRLISQAIC